MSDSPTPGRSEIESKLAKALRHPVRADIFHILSEKVSSPKQLSVQLGVKLQIAYYHVNVLKKLELIELVDTQPVRGATEHFYRSIQLPYFHGKDWAEFPVSARQAVSGSEVQTVFRDVVKSLEAGKFDARSDRHLSLTSIVLDDQAWKELGQGLHSFVWDVLSLQAEAFKRLGKGKGDVIPVSLALLAYEVDGHGEARAG